MGAVQRLRRLDAPRRHPPEVGSVSGRRARRPRFGAPGAGRRHGGLRLVGGRHVADGLAAQLGDEVGQGAAVDELHGVVVDAALAANPVDGNDVGVVQPRRGPGLVVEALQLPRVERAGERQHLERYPPAQRQLLRLVDDAHAAAAHLADEAEIPQLLQRRRRRGLAAGRLPLQRLVGQGDVLHQRHGREDFADLGG
jgi:hypothetical protein